MSLQFQIWDAADPGHRLMWIDAWTKWPGRELHAHPDYVRLYAGKHARALCAAASTGGSHPLYPFLLNDLSAQPWCEASLCGYTDISSPYGYAGPFQWGSPWEASRLSAFWEGFDSWARDARAVSEVVRFSLFPESLARYPGECRVISENVVRTIAGEAELWRDVEYKVRTNVSRARASGVTVLHDRNATRLDDFIRIFHGTMDRRNAAEIYYFSRDFFQRILADLSSHVEWFHACIG